MHLSRIDLLFAEKEEQPEDLKSIILFQNQGETTAILWSHKKKTEINYPPPQSDDEASQRAQKHPHIRNMRGVK